MFLQQHVCADHLSTSSRSDNVMLSELYAPTEPQSKNLWFLTATVWHVALGTCNAMAKDHTPAT